jgi:DNA-binding winged helix-turn-helix (wHTH) protein/tetratricopeptide (TPR) repeat protein
VAEQSPYEFGPFRVDVVLSRLERAGEPIPLPPKTFDLLVVLARNHERVVSKTELMEALWPDTFVEDANLTQHVYTLRKTLGDQANGRPYIETVARRGYRLAAAVRQSRADAGESRSAAEPPAGQRSIGAAVLEGERKHATVVYCSLSNAAAIVERLGAGGLRDLMARLTNIAGEEIERYEGVINERHADGFVAIFGAPVVHEDDGRRAVLAALAMVRRSKDLLKQDSPDEDESGLQMGVNTGPVVISRVVDERRVEFTAVGETRRAAELLHQFAAPGDIFVSDATRRVIEKFIAVEPVRVGSTIGTAYRVVGVLHRPSAPERPSHMTRALAPFVGREEELALLTRLQEAALGGRGQIVGIVGEPGMGKSRLVYEFTRSRRDEANPSTTLEGRCVSYGSLIPYLPLSELIRSHCGVDEADSPESIRTAIDRAIQENGLPPDAGTWLLRLIGMMDAPAALETLSPEAIKARTFDVLRQLFLKTAARRPLIIVVEDVHWIDRTSEEFLATLAERIAAARVMLLATHRPGYAAPWMHRSYTSQLTLTALPHSESTRLVQSVAHEKTLAPDVSSAILRRGEGNPFFLEELARTVIEQGAGPENIPETVHGVIMARVDRLPDASKQLMQTAAVIGREVPLGLLKRVWNGPPNIDAELDALCRHEFIYERPSGDEPAYVFKHALTQDVAYDSLLARNRRDLHLRTARALEELFAERLDEVAATLAYHFARTDLVTEAVDWLTRAADQAARVYANAEAILHLDLAARRLQRLPEGADRDRRMLDVALRHAHSLYFLGRFKESIAVLQPHEARLARLNDPALAAAYSFWLAHMYSRLGDQRRAAESAQRSIAAGTAAGDEATVGKAHGLLALEGHWAGKPKEGIAHGAAALTRLRCYPEQRWWLGMAHFYLAVNHLLIGDFDAALAETAHADAVGKDIGDPRLQTYAGYTAGWVEGTRGNHDCAVALCRRSREQAPDRVSRAYATLWLGFVLVEKGDSDEAASVLEPTIGELEGFGFPQWHSMALTLTGEALRMKGRLEESAALVNRGLHVATQCQYWYSVGYTYRVAARLARDRGSSAGARVAYETALDTFERIQATYEAARTNRELSELRSQNQA